MRSNHTEQVCPKCQSKDISFSTALEENRGAGESCFLSYIVMVLLLFIPVLGWVLLFAMFNEKRKPVSVTYALCSKYGYGWKLKQTAKKKNRKLITVSVLLIVIVAMAVQFYFMGKYKG